MTLVKDIMVTDVITVSPDMEITQATKILLENHINGVPVVDYDDAVIGILCQSDLIAQQKDLPIPSVFTILDGLIPLSSLKSIEKEVQKIAATTVRDAMTPNPVSVTPSTHIKDVANLMVNRCFHTLPVIENGKLVGILGKEDILKLLLMDKSH